MGAVPKIGVPMSPAEAEEFVDELNGKVLRRWEERETRAPFMKELSEGRLSMAVIKLFFRNWGAFTIEINTLIAPSYKNHIAFLRRRADLLGRCGGKSRMPLKKAN